MSCLSPGRHVASKLLFGSFVLLGLTAFTSGSVTSLVDPSFNTESPGGLADGSGVGQWNSYGDNGDTAAQHFTVESGIAHTGTQAIVNTESFTSSPSGYTNLYQYETADSAATLDGQTVSYSFWLYYDPSMSGQNQSTDSIGYDFDARDTNNVTYASSIGTINASSLTADTWTNFTGSFVVPATSSATQLGAVLQAPRGTWYADDFSLSIPSVAVPEPATLTGIALLACVALTRRRRSIVTAPPTV